jgi:hypothetical protein
MLHVCSNSALQLHLLGYKQELGRHLSSFHNFATTFSFLSPITGQHLRRSVSTYVKYSTGSCVSPAHAWGLLCVGCSCSTLEPVKSLEAYMCGFICRAVSSPCGVSYPHCYCPPLHTHALWLFVCACWCLYCRSHGHLPVPLPVWRSRQYCVGLVPGVILQPPAGPRVGRDLQRIPHSKCGRGMQ